MKLYVEVTHTEQSDTNTGISRVVRNVLRNLMDLGCEEEIVVLPTIIRNGSFVIVSPESVLEPKASRHQNGERNGIMARWTNRLVCGYSTCQRRVRKFVIFRLGTSVAKLIRAEPNEQHVLLLLD